MPTDMAADWCRPPKRFNGTTNRDDSKSKRFNERATRDDDNTERDDKTTTRDDLEAKRFNERPFPAGNAPACFKNGQRRMISGQDTGGRVLKSRGATIVNARAYIQNPK